MNRSFIDYDIYLPGGADFPKERCKGDNQKAVLIVYKQEPDNQLGLLEKILKAIKLEMSTDTALLELEATEKISFKPVFQESLFKTVLLFGVQPSALGLPLEIPFYEAIHHQGIQFIRSESLTKIAKDQNSKGLLWNCLKVNFLPE